MEFIENLKLGALEGITAAIVLLTVIVAAVAILIVILINGVKAVKEHKDALEDKKEDEFFAQYGVTGEELRLNRKLSEMREKLRSDKRIKEELLDEKHIVIVHDTVEVPVEAENIETENADSENEAVADDVTAVQEDPVVYAEPEYVPEPVIEDEEPVAEPESVEEPEPIEEAEPIEDAEPAEEVAPAEDTVPEEAIPEEELPVTVEADTKSEPIEAKKESEPEEDNRVVASSDKLVPKKKEDDWSKYDGEYEGVYYDPEDACYYEGTPSPEIAEKLATKQAELEAQAKKDKKNKKKKKEVIVKRIAPPFLALKTPKNERKKPESVEGFDESVIYGKYVIEHVTKEDGSEEYFYTLYAPNDKVLYESSNYSALEYCHRAITRFQTHVLVGMFMINVEDMKFYFELRRKTYVHKGEPQNTFEDANALVSEVKSYAQTDIIREQ